MTKTNIHSIRVGDLEVANIIMNGGHGPSPRAEVNSGQRLYTLNLGLRLMLRRAEPSMV